MARARARPPSLMSVLVRVGTWPEAEALRCERGLAACRLSRRNCSVSTEAPPLAQSARGLEAFFTRDSLNGNDRHVPH